MYTVYTTMSDGQFKSDRCGGHLAMKRPAYTAYVE